MCELENLFEEISAQEIIETAQRFAAVKKQYLDENLVCNVFVKPLRMVAFDQN